MQGDAVLGNTHPHAVPDSVSSVRFGRRLELPWGVMGERHGTTGRARSAVGHLLGLLLLLVVACQTARADWLNLNALAQATNASAPQRSGQLDAAVARLKPLAAASKGAALAAAVSQEGHWSFANTAGETFTAATPQELKRAIATLAPELDVTGAKTPPVLTLLLTEDTVFRHRPLLKDLPATADLRLVVDQDVLPLRRRGDMLHAEVRPNLLVALTDRGDLGGGRAQFDEVVWQLNRPLKSANIRVLALEPGGPATLAGAPKLDAVTRRPLIDRLDPLRAADGLRSIRGQTAVITGRSEGKLLFVRGSSGPEQSIILSDLTEAAAAADVNLLLLQSANARQPGARNWLWQTAQVAGLDDALARAKLADLLAVIGARERPLAVSTTAPTGPIAGLDGQAAAVTDSRRVTLTAVSDAALPGPLDSMSPVGRTTEVIGGAIGDMMSGLTGKLNVTAATLHLQSRARATALQWRMIPSVPLGWIEGYVAALLVGLLGWRWTWPWWQRLWPAEGRKDYDSAFGYQTARAARLLLMTVLFLPLAGLALLPAAVYSWFKAKPLPAPAAASGSNSGQ
jgi:hypothetical protein